MENIENTDSERRTYIKLSIDVKMLTISLIQRNPEKSIAEVARNLSMNEHMLRYRYSNIVFSALEVIYIDDIGFYLHIRRLYGRGQRGKRAHIVLANSRGRNISVCASMNISGLLNYRSFVVSFNKNQMCQFFQEFFQKCSNTSKIFVMDNVHFHHSTEVREVVELQGHQIIVIQPHSPKFNPIELLFSNAKIL
ncbi:hypothetical protein RF11_13077 [Thelohanellus kitauei]|uniref:Tc1-like transposase DDE domain-containing protein n=1 Tax=Thelohanellus kitauei TaxID=669202 RepID=A0A0C2MRJ1_THEKT|nr:hypothetical protein RF11_13077 [Thelohanellus kitauei]